MANLEGDSDIYLSVTLGSPSLIIRCVTIRALKTIVHVESRSLCCSVRNISATPASPAWVATRMCSMYFDFGAASCQIELAYATDFLKTLELSDLLLGPALHGFFERSGHGDTRTGGLCREQYGRPSSKCGCPLLDSHHRDRGTFLESTNNSNAVTHLNSSWQVHGRLL